LDAIPLRIGAERAAQLQCSRWWPALVTAVDHGVQRGWIPAGLLANTPVDDGRVDECLALVWRISTLTDPPRTLEDEPEPPHPADEPPDDLWDGYQPTHPVTFHQVPPVGVSGPGGRCARASGRWSRGGRRRAYSVRCYSLIRG